MACWFQRPAIVKVKLHLRCLTVSWMYFLIQMLLYYQYCCSCYLFSYFIIGFIILALTAFVLSFSIFSDVGLLCYLLWTILYILLVFLSHPFMRVVLFKSSYTDILQEVLSWLTLNCSMLFYCFNHYFNDISMVTLFEH